MNNSVHDAFDASPLRRQEFFFWCCATVAVLFFLWRDPLFGDESLIAEAAREITLTGIWWPFRINFKPYPDLPVLEVWSVAASFSIFGVSEFAARLPAALATLALLTGIRQLARSLFDRRTALITGWLTIGSYGFLYLGRNAAGGMAGCAAVIWAVACYFSGEKAPGFWKNFGFSFFAMLSGFSGDPCFVLLPFAFLLPLLWRSPQAKGLFSWRGIAAFVPVSAAAVAAWLWISGNTLGGVWDAVGNFFCKNITSSGAEISSWILDRHEPFYAGVYDLPRILLPWVLAVAAAFASVFIHIRTISSSVLRLCLGVLFGFFICSSPTSADWQNFVPLLPIVALITAEALANHHSDTLNHWAVMITRTVIVLLASLGVASPVALPVWNQLTKTEMPMVVILIVPSIGFAVLFLMLLDSHPRRPLCWIAGLPERLGSTILGGSLITICFISLVIPPLRELRTERSFYRSLKPLVSEMGTESIIFIGDAAHSAPMLYYTGVEKSIHIIEEGDNAEFLKVINTNKDKVLAIVSRCRKNRELKFIREVSLAAGLKIDVNNPDYREYSRSGYDEESRKHWCWRIGFPLQDAVKNKR